jgi:hypothetical protein
LAQTVRLEVTAVDDRDIVERISQLADEEHALERNHAAAGLGADDNARMEQLEVLLDQCWDLLRQRRARRHAGLDPDDATVRPADIVEHYRQ